MTTPAMIGLSTLRETTTWGDWTEPTAFLQTTYVDAIAGAGGAPVLLPPADDSMITPELARQVVGRLDGLIITGGTDVDPARYGERPHPRTDPPRPERDAWEFALLDATDRLRLPTLGICRGAQLMTVWAGGRLQQHLPDVVGDDRHSPADPVFRDVEITTTPTSRLNMLIGDRLVGGCHHHQAIAEHPGFTAAAYAADGTVEGIERDEPCDDPRAQWFMGVQWHPEIRTDRGLFAGLVAAASESGAAATHAPPARP